ncbi:MAG: outer membrane beta-barrel protein [Candidatus Sulfotelmatobacter sp.]
MNRLAIAITMIALITLISSCAYAQNSTPKVQVFGGYSLVHIDNGGLTGVVFNEDLRERNAPFSTSSNYQGWNVEGQYNFTRWLGVAADFGGRYGKPITEARFTTLSGLPTLTGYSFLFGPVISLHNKSKFTPFIHALFGYDRINLTAGPISGVNTPLSSVGANFTDAALLLGGGVDYKVFKIFSLRLAQVDDFHTTHDLNTFYGTAFPTGVFTGLQTHQSNLRVSTGIVVSF